MENGMICEIKEYLLKTEHMGYNSIWDRNIIYAQPNTVNCIYQKKIGSILIISLYYIFF